MGTLARPGPQLGFKGPPDAGQAESEPFFRWFLEFLRNELKPYPGRLALVSRMTLAATLTMVAIMAFRLPGAAIAAYYTLLLSRESPTNTVRAALTVLVSYLLGAAYTLLGVLLFVDYPLTHFLWVMISIFLCFYVIKVTTNYVASAAFAFILTIAIPIWDTPAPTGVLLVATLWAAGSVSVGLICTVAVEYLFSGFDIKNELHIGLASRTSAVSAFLRCVAQKGVADKVEADRIEQLAMIGVSRLRSLAANSANPERRSTTVSLAGRLVDVAAALSHAPRPLEDRDRERLREAAARLDSLLHHLGSPTPTAPAPEPTQPGGDPLVSEVERTTELLQLSVSSDAREGSLTFDRPVSTKVRTFVADAFSNPDHLTYSLRGCLAAMLCYVIFNAIAWRGLSTSLATCVITALTSIGSSRQKQVLRIAGAIVGGLFFGIGSQVLILPMLDSIAGFAVLFAVVTFVSAWIGTASPRLSYFGLQIALAFFLIHLQEYFPQTNLAIARDRVMGVGLGLVMMWLVFDTLGSKPAAQVMREIFATNLRLLAELARPWREGKKADKERLGRLRDRLSANFGSVNAQADAVLFELGPSRQQDLALRNRLLAWQPRLRSLFLLEVALLQYRTEISPHELAPEIVAAQAALDRQASAVLEDMADAFANRSPPKAHLPVYGAYKQLEDAVQTTYGGKPTPRAQGVLAFSSYMAELLDHLSEELRVEPGP